MPPPLSRLFSSLRPLLERGPALLNPEALMALGSKRYFDDPTRWLPLDVWFRGTTTVRKASNAVEDPNNYLGKHYAALPEVADDFARGIYRNWDPTGGVIVPVKIEASHPRIYPFEQDLLADMNAMSGHLYSSGLRETSRKRAELFKHYLEDQGYDAILYGNMVEGPSGNTAAIATRPESVRAAQDYFVNPASQILEFMLTGKKLPREIYDVVPSAAFVNAQKGLRRAKTYAASLTRQGLEFNRRTEALKPYTPQYAYPSSSSFTPPPRFSSLSPTLAELFAHESKIKLLGYEIAALRNWVNRARSVYKSSLGITINRGRAPRSIATPLDRQILYDLIDTYVGSVSGVSPPVKSIFDTAKQAIELSRFGPPGRGYQDAMNKAIGLLANRMG